MPSTTLDTKTIELLQDIPGLTPVVREYYEGWTVRSLSRELFCPRNYLSPNRRDFYKVMLITKATAVFTMGMNTYYIDEPTLLFIPPTEIISWKSLADHSKAYYCVFKKTFVDEHPNLKTVIDKFHLFSDPGRWVVRLKDKEVPALVKLFEQMEDETASGSPLAEDTIQAYLQLVMIESIKIANYPKPDSTNDEFRHIHQFFHLLERETASINYINPIRIKTAKEFAADLSLTPNYLNALLKKHTGQNVSTHIRNRLLDESKALLLQTDWTVQDIGYAIGFADQPNFSTFFKKLTGITPIDFRKQQNS